MMKRPAVLVSGAARMPPSPEMAHKDMAGLDPLEMVSGCDKPEHDDTASLQAAAQQAAVIGRPLMVTEKCRVNGTIRTTDERSD